MILRLQSLALLGALLSLPLPSTCQAETLRISPDTPVASLISSAKSFLARGASKEALTFFDAAVAKDPKNYQALFHRGATYLSLGRNGLAGADFDSVLSIKPDFEAARLQRARIKARNADWDGARDDYSAAGEHGGKETLNLEEAEGAAALAAEAERLQDWDGCISHAGVAILTASTALSLRQLRARCRFERGEAEEGLSDLAHVQQINPGLVEPHLQMSSMLFYSLGDTDRGLSQTKKCLHSDPDSKSCKSLFRRQKIIIKNLDQVKSLMESSQFNSATKILVGSNAETDPGLVRNVKEGVVAAKLSGMIHPKAPDNLYASLIERTCQCYREMNSPRKATPYCTEALTLNPTSLHGLLHRAQSQLDADDYDAAISTLNTAKEHHPNSQAVQSKLQEVHTLMKRSKQKDYYKVLGVDRSADQRTMKRAYRTLTKQHHPDKAQAQGVTKEAAEKKMAQINEAWEVLSDPELKAKFDRGEDPNDPMASQGGNPFQGSPFGGGQQFFFQQSGGGGGQRFKFSAGGGGGNPFGGFPFG